MIRIIIILLFTFGCKSFIVLEKPINAGRQVGSRLFDIRNGRAEKSGSEAKASAERTIEKVNGLQKFRLPEELSVANSRLLLFSIAAAYGTNYAAVKTLGDELDPSLASLLRFGLSTIIFIPNVLKYSKVPYLVRSGLEIGILNFIGYLGQSLALHEGLQGSAVAFICSLAVVVVPILDAILGKDQVQRSTSALDQTEYKKISAFFPSIVSAVGVGFLTGFGSDGLISRSTPGATGSSIYAYVAACMQPLLFGLAYFRQPTLIRKSCSEPGHYLAFTGSSLIAVALGALLWVSSDVGLSNGLRSLGGFLEHAMEAPNVVLAILWTGLVTTAGTTLLENLAMKQLTGTESTIIYSTEPLFATLFGFLLLGESISTDTVIGGCLILVAIALSVQGDDA